MDVVYLAMLLLVLHCALPIYGQSPHEPTCTSRYDYEHKVLHAIVKMEIEQESLREHIGNVIRDAESERRQTIEAVTELQQAVENKNVEIKKLVNRVEELEGNDKSDVIAELRQLVENSNIEIQALSKSIQELEQSVSAGLSGDRNSAGYTFKDDLAQATCTSLGSKHVYAVRRQCSNQSASCDVTCQALGLACVNSLHVYDRPAMTSDAVGKIGLRVYRYNTCSGNYCGPNYCCCTGG